MTDIGLLFLIAVIFFGVISLVVNRDIFSPVKWYFLSLVIFFSGIYIKEQQTIVYFIFFVYIVIGITAIALEKMLITSKTLNKKQAQVNPIVKVEVVPFKLERRLLYGIWLLTCIPILAQIAMIYNLGGLFNYIHSITTRVKDWQGMGMFLLLLKFAPIINVVFLILGCVVNFRRKKTWWFFYGLHLILCIGLAGISGSRSGLLFLFVNIIIVYHYWVKPIKFRTALFMLFILLFLSVLLNVLRNEINKVNNVSDITSTVTNKSYRYLNNPSFNSGVQPLNVMLDNDSFTDFQYGVTYLTAFTNFIPRQIYQNKPSSAGVVITKYMQGSDYGGTTNISPGAIAEGIINFGYTGGLVFGFIVIVLVMIFVLKIYQKFQNRLLFKSRLPSSIKQKVRATFMYILFYQAFASILSAEFTALFNGIFTSLIIFFLIEVYLNRTMKKIKNTCADKVQNLEYFKGVVR
jgi:oligosaccharide repeat unit polymerase